MRYWQILFSVIMLTTPDGTPIWVETTHIQTIRPDKNTCHPHAKSVVLLDQGKLCVMETPEDIQAIANDRRH